MKFKLFQIQFNDAQINQINSAAQRPAYYEAYLNTRLNPTVEAIEKAWRQYEIVAEIEADNLEEVFEIGNIGPEENIKRLKPMSSISVGDVVADNLGITYFVAPIGFKKLPVRMYQLPAEYDIQL